MAVFKADSLQIKVVFVFSLLFCQNLHADLETAADSLLLLLPLSAVGLSYFENDKEGRSSFYKSFGATFLSTVVLKSAINAPRPEDGPEADANDSFPSGHTSLAFSSASFIQRRYGWQLGAPAYLLASYVGWSRVKTKHHHSADVFAGALLGASMSFVFVSKREEFEVNVSHNSLRLSMSF